MDRINSLRDYIAVLEKAGLLTHISKPVSLEHELANVAFSIIRQGRGAAMFDAPKDSPWPIFTGAVATPVLAAAALQCSLNEITSVMDKALDPKAGIAPQVVTNAAWKNHIFTNDNIDIRKLPIPIHAQNDGGAFITGGVTVSKDPVSGRGNLSYNRMQVLGPKIFGFNCNEWRHTMQFYKNQENENQPLQVAIAIGLDPAIMIAAGARYDGDELCIAGAIRGEGVPVCKGVTVDINIPAEAEIVIEGYLPPLERQLEGPLAEFHGYYGEQWNCPVFHVTAICYRDNPIYQTIIPGVYEHVYIGNVLPREPLLARFVRHVSPDMVALHIPPYSNGFSAIIQLNKKNPGEPKNAAMAAFAAHVNIKQVIVVDADVNIYDPADVHWALTNRVDWSRDAFYVPGAQGHEMDPTADTRGVHTKIGIDATYKPERRPYGQRTCYPDIDLSPYL